MTPDEATIAAYLALPLAAQRALVEKAEGPGWYCFPESEDAILYDECGHVLLGRPLPAGAAWIPASEAETLRVWDDVDQAFRWDGCVDWGGTYDSRLRAAAECCPVEASGGEAAP